IFHHARTLTVIKPLRKDVLHTRETALPEFRTTYDSEQQCGAMAEWSIAHAWKACIGQPIEGSNPSRSAIISMRINEMGLARPENPKLPRGFVNGIRTPETAEIAKIGL